MKILVAVDSSDFADEVLRRIVKRSWSENSKFLVITVVEVTGKEDIDRPMLHQAQIILDERVNVLAKKLHHHVSGEVIEGNADSMILKTAKSWDADLIILGSHGDTGVRRDRLGSVAAAVVNEAPCSVEVIKIHHSHKARNESHKSHASAYSGS